jgi:hypothetical protein
MKTITKMICISSDGWGKCHISKTGGDILTIGKVYDIVSGEEDSFGTKKGTYFESDTGFYYMLETKSILETTFTPLSKFREDKLKQLGI